MCILFVWVLINVILAVIIFVAVLKEMAMDVTHVLLAAQSLDAKVQNEAEANLKQF